MKGTGSIPLDPEAGSAAGLPDTCLARCSSILDGHMPWSTAAVQRGGPSSTIFNRQIGASLKVAPVHKQSAMNRASPSTSS